MTEKKSSSFIPPSQQSRSQPPTVSTPEGEKELTKSPENPLLDPGNVATPSITPADTGDTSDGRKGLPEKNPNRSVVAGEGQLADALKDKEEYYGIIQQTKNLLLAGLRNSRDHERVSKDAVKQALNVLGVPDSDIPAGVEDQVKPVL